MLQKSDILYILKVNKPELNKFGVTKIGLFGSYIHKEERPQSDIDILIDFDSKSENFINFMNTCNFLETLFQGKRIDIVTINGLSPYIGPHILKDVEYA